MDVTPSNTVVINNLRLTRVGMRGFSAGMYPSGNPGFTFLLCCERDVNN